MHPTPTLTVEQYATRELLPYANNAKIHTREQIDQIEASIKEFGFNDPVAVWENPAGELEIIEGHGRVIAAKNLQIETLPVIRLDHLNDEQRRAYTHVHNQLTLNTGWDFETLEQDLNALDFDFSDFGFEGAFSELEREIDELPNETEQGETLAQRFGVVPFTVLDARKGEWGERKRAWIDLGVQSEIGRGGGLVYDPKALNRMKQYRKTC